MTDFFEKHSTGLDSPGEEHFDITPSDTVDMEIRPRSIYIGVGGSLTLRSKKGVDVTYQPGDDSYILFKAVRVMATGTTATGLIGVY